MFRSGTEESMLKPKLPVHSANDRHATSPSVANKSAAVLSRPANRPLNFQIGDGQASPAMEGRAGTPARNIIGRPHARLQGDPTTTEFVDGDRRRGRGTVS